MTILWPIIYVDWSIILLHRIRFKYEQRKYWMLIHIYHNINPCITSFWNYFNFDISYYKMYYCLLIVMAYHLLQITNTLNPTSKNVCPEKSYPVDEYVFLNYLISELWSDILLFQSFNGWIFSVFQFSFSVGPEMILQWSVVRISSKKMTCVNVSKDKRIFFTDEEWRTHIKVIRRINI